MLLCCLAVTALCAAQPQGGGSSAGSNLLSFAPGTGFEVDFSRHCVNYSVPVELRLFSVKNSFNFSVGERFSFHKAKPDQGLYPSYTYYSTLHNPYINYKQFATYLAARWNIIPATDTSRVALFAGAAYLFCLNADGRVFVDVPQQGPWDGADQTTYDWMLGSGWQEYGCNRLLNTVSHSLRLELGVTTPAVELSLFGVLPLSSPVNLDYADRTLYYDRNHLNTAMMDHPVTHSDGPAPYLPIRLTDSRNVVEGLSDRFTLGFGLKVFIVPKYYRNLFARR